MFGAMGSWASGCAVSRRTRDAKGFGKLWRASKYVGELAHDEEEEEEEEEEEKRSNQFMTLNMTLKNN